MTARDAAAVHHPHLKSYSPAIKDGCDDVCFAFCCRQSLATWESENKIQCKQTLVEGDGPKTFWTRELNGDELTLVRMRASE